MIPEPEDTFSMRSSHVVLDQVEIAFDDLQVVASAGLLLPATLAERLGIEQATDQLVDLGDRPGAARPGRKLLTVVHALVAGGDCIDDVELLRSGATASVLGHRVMAASTVGTFLRAFTFGHVRQLDRLTETILGRAWAAGAGPDDGPLVVDVDSTICEVHGYHKQGACYGYTHRLGYHPLLATRADTGEVLHARLRKGAANTARGILRFVDALVARLRRAGASGELTLRMDSGFWSAKLIKRLRRHRVRYSITVRQTKTVRAAIAQIPEHDWVDIAYQPSGACSSVRKAPSRAREEVGIGMAAQPDSHVGHRQPEQHKQLHRVKSQAESVTSLGEAIGLGTAEAVEGGGVAGGVGAGGVDVDLVAWDQPAGEGDAEEHRVLAVAGRAGDMVGTAGACGV
jgi:hypothetical protein